VEDAKRWLAPLGALFDRGISDDTFHRTTAAGSPRKLARRIENALDVDELKTHLRGAPIVLRSKTPELAQQEFTLRFAA
jgi:hypothetical protein